jgi:hypothetical protein
MFEKFNRTPHKPLYVALAFVLVVVGIFLANEQPWKSFAFAAPSRIASDDKVAGAGVSTSSLRFPTTELDIHNADTDGDGTNDGAEVFAGRDPTKKGPDDKLKYLQDPKFATSSTDIEGIRKDFIAKYLAQSVQKTNEDTFRLLMGNFRATNYKTKYELVDLNISSESDVAALRKYGNEFGKYIEKYSIRTHRTEEEILAEGFKTKNSETMKELQYPAITYRAFTDDLRKMAVPLPLADAHLEIVNGYDLMSRGLLGMQNIFTDPINGSAGNQAYMKARFSVTDGYAKLVLLFKKNNVAFDKTELGAPFTWPPTALK